MVTKEVELEVPDATEKWIPPATKNEGEGNIIQLNHKCEIFHLHILKCFSTPVACLMVIEMGHWDSESHYVAKENMFFGVSEEGAVYSLRMWMAADYLFEIYNIFAQGTENVCIIDDEGIWACSTNRI